MSLSDQIFTLGPALSLNVPVAVVPLTQDARATMTEQGYEHLLGIEQVRDVVEELEEQLGRPLSLAEAFRAVVHFKRHDTVIDPTGLRNAIAG